MSIWGKTVKGFSELQVSEETGKIDMPAAHPEPCSKTCGNLYDFQEAF